MTTATSSKGRTPDFDFGNDGSSPSVATIKVTVDWSWNTAHVPVSDEFRKEMDAWLLDFFGHYESKIYRCELDGKVSYFVSPRVWASLCVTPCA